MFSKNTTTRYLNKCQNDIITEAFTSLTQVYMKRNAETYQLQLDGHVFFKC